MLCILLLRCDGSESQFFKRLCEDFHGRPVYQKVLERPPLSWSRAWVWGGGALLVFRASGFRMNFSEIPMSDLLFWTSHFVWQRERGREKKETSGSYSLPFPPGPCVASFSFLGLQHLGQALKLSASSVLHANRIKRTLNQGARGV